LAWRPLEEAGTVLKPCDPRMTAMVIVVEAVVMVIEA
jgi:hypothetical protein